MLSPGLTFGYGQKSRVTPRIVGETKHKSKIGVGAPDTNEMDQTNGHPVPRNWISTKPYIWWLAAEARSRPVCAKSAIHDHP
jgi:hypothetical protein